MKTLNTTRNVVIKYPRNTPRISRKRLWMDRNPMRQQPEATYGSGTQEIDRAFDAARNPGEISQTPYQGFPDLMQRAARVGIKRS